MKVKNPFFKRAVMAAFAIPLSAIAFFAIWSPDSSTPQEPASHQSRVAVSTSELPNILSTGPAPDETVSPEGTAVADAGHPNETMSAVPAKDVATQADSTVSVDSSMPIDSAPENGSAPEILSPRENALIPITDRTLRWSPVSSADSYDILITDTVRWQKVFSKVGLKETQLTLDNGIFHFGGKYSVTVHAASAGAVSGSSRIDFGIQDQAAPVITGPADKSALRISDLTVQWKPVAGAESYKVVVTDTFTWKKLHTAVVRNATSLVLEKSLFSIGGQYRIYLMASFEGNDTKPSYVDISTFRLSSPRIVSPVKEAVQSLNDIQVQWEPVLMAEKYGVSLTDLASGKVLYTEEGFRDCRSVISRKHLVPGMTYRVFVHSCAGDNLSEPTWTDVSVLPLSPPDITMPTNGTILPSTDQRVEWTQVEMADSYRIAVTDTNAWQVIFLSDPTSEPFYMLDKSLFSTGGQYRIYVHATLGKTDSVPAYVDVRAPVLAPPYILAPKNAAYLPSAEVELIWSQIANAESYRVTVTNTNTWEIVFSRDGIDATSLLLDPSLFAAEGNYRIYVASVSGTTESAPNYIDIGIGNNPGKTP